MESFSVKDYFSNRLNPQAYQKLRFFGDDYCGFNLKSGIVNNLNGLVGSSEAHIIHEVNDSFFCWHPIFILDLCDRLGPNPALWDNSRLSTYLNARVAHAEKSFGYRRDSSVLEIKNRDVISLHSSKGMYRYGHLHDYLQQLWFFVKRPDIASQLKKPLILLSDPSPILSFDNHLRSIGLDFDYAFLNPSIIEYVKADSLWRCISPAYYTDIHPEYYDKVIMQQVHAMGAPICPDNRYNIYVSRVGYDSLTSTHLERRVLNERDLVASLKGLGFVILDGKTKLPEIVKYVSSAKSLVSIHGSFLVNAIYAPSDCKIVELSNKHGDTSFKDKYKRCADYSIINVARDENWNIEVPLSLIINALDGKT